MDAQTIVDTVAALDDDTGVSIITAILQSRPELAPPLVTFAVPDFTYPPSKSLTERRAKGVVKSYNPEKGFGFIACEELNQVFGCDVFVHGKQIGDQSFIPGSTVSFAVVLNKDNRPQAYDIQHDSGKGLSKGCGSFGSMESPSSMKGGGSFGFGGRGGPTFNASAMIAMMKSNWGAEFGGDSAPAPMGGKMGGKMSGKGNSFGGSFGGGKGPIVKSQGLQCDESQVLGTFWGSIKIFHADKGFGFIECSDLKAQGYEKDVWLHTAQLNGFSQGSQVQFTCFINNKGTPQAKDLEDASGGGPAKKARLGEWAGESVQW